MFRVEDKYLLNELNMFFLEKRLSSIMEPDSFSVNGGYLISSIYFDDINDTCLQDVIDGIEKRNKYRIRIYDNSLKTIKLEIKHKDHNHIFKEGCIISEEELTEILKGNTIREESNEAPCNNALSQFNYAIKTKGLKPKVIVTYERTALVSEAGNVRITFDRNIRSSDRFDLFGSEDLVSNSVDVVTDFDSIVEVKYDELLPSYISDFLEMGNMWQVSCSKYELCREAIKCQ